MRRILALCRYHSESKEVHHPISAESEVGEGTTFTLRIGDY